MSFMKGVFPVIALVLLDIQRRLGSVDIDCLLFKLHAYRNWAKIHFGCLSLILETSYNTFE